MILQRTRLKCGNIISPDASARQVLKILTTRASSDESKAYLAPPCRLFVAFCLRAATLIYGHLIHNLSDGLADPTLQDATFRCLEGANATMARNRFARMGLPRHKEDPRNMYFVCTGETLFSASCIQYYRPAFLVPGSSADFYGSLSTSTCAEKL